MLYLDNSATSIRKPVRVYASLIYNTLFNSANAGRGSHGPSLRALTGIMNTQEAAARLFNVSNPLNIAFTYNATYALNMIISGVLADGEHVIVTQMDHNSVLRPVFRHGEYTVVDADASGYVSPADIEDAIRPNTRLIVCTHASNVCGTLQPIEEIGAIARKHGVLFAVDAAQTAGCATVDAEAIHADFIAFSGHKGLMGPLGTGGLYVRNPETIRPIITGGTGSQSESMVQPRVMPDMLHSGTVNAPGVAALGKAIDFVANYGVEAIGNREAAMANRFADNLMNMDNVTVYGRKKRTGAVAFNIGRFGSEEVSALIGKRAVVRAGYHCAPLAHKALGTSKRGAVRTSFGFYSTMRDVEKITDIIYEINRDAGR